MAQEYAQQTVDVAEENFRSGLLGQAQAQRDKKRQGI